LEKRFSAQRYLSPHDRDRIAYELQLSTAQVITWFQNRRAKQKRDIEEMKNDVNAAKNLKVIDGDLNEEQAMQNDSIQQNFNLNDTEEDDEEDDREGVDDNDEEINVDDNQNDQSTNETTSGDASIQSPKSLS
jgi:homeobox protein LBX